MFSSSVQYSVCGLKDSKSRSISKNAYVFISVLSQTFLQFKKYLLNHKKHWIYISWIKKWFQKLCNIFIVQKTNWTYPENREDPYDLPYRHRTCCLAHLPRNTQNSSKRYFHMMSLKPNEYIHNSTRVYMVKNNFNSKYDIPWVSLLAKNLKHRLSPSLL